MCKLELEGYSANRVLHHRSERHDLACLCLMPAAESERRRSVSAHIFNMVMAKYPPEHVTSVTNAMHAASCSPSVQNDGEGPCLAYNTSLTLACALR